MCKMLSLMMRENKDESGFVPSPRSSRASGGDEACVQNMRQDVSPAIKEGIRIKATVCKAPLICEALYGTFYNPPNNPRGRSYHHIHVTDEETEAYGAGQLPTGQEPGSAARGAQRKRFTPVQRPGRFVGRDGNIITPPPPAPAF